MALFLFVEALTDRSVRIFTPAKPATQSGKNGTRLWRIDFDILGKRMA
jgi:NADH dehydrogenase (ubiquinone) Fe-S protein 4